MPNPLDSNPAWLSPYPVLPLSPRPRSYVQRWPGLRKWAAQIIAAGGTTVTNILDYREATDIHTSGWGTDWVDVTGAIPLVKLQAASTLSCQIGGFAYYIHAGELCSLRLSLDAGSQLSGALSGCVGNNNPLAGAAPWLITGLAAGAHTLTLQARDLTAGGQIYIWGSSYGGDRCPYTLQVTEYLQP